MNNYTNQFNRMLAVARTEDYLVLDTETNVLDNARICQIAITDSGGNVLLNAQVNPEAEIPTAASDIHGIKAAHVAYAPTLAVIAPVLEFLLLEQNIFVYNKDFDLRVLANHARKVGIKDPCRVSSDWFCAMNMYAEFYGDWNDYHQSYRWQKLGQAASRFGSFPDAAHDALNDCLSTRAVLNGMVAALTPADDQDVPF